MSMQQLAYAHMSTVPFLLNKPRTMKSAALNDVDQEM